ncbi:PAS domain S-box protein [Duganella sp. FT135W]|uniref:PAS domain S-box protein n=1 Tax=Duganella flavida TaxID=2692175 RepID=A0A6L8K603_9BURK|nr:chemotaxis protein CheB [Duganella flavida]MYM21334.1 PAS domain S-box protein [Duganella flavida]
MSGPDVSPQEPHDDTSGLPELAPDFLETESADSMDDAVPSRGYGMLPVVGLGGSAGSIAALRKFFDTAPSNGGLAYVVVLHLDPTHESTMPELLQRHTAMPVRSAQSGMKFEADHVYVIPQGSYVLADDGHIRLQELQHEPGKRVAVDLFFRSLADSHGAHATAVVLSGADGDGAIGLKRIKERGGLTIVQDPQEAEYPSMPTMAIGTGMVDWVLPVSHMAQRIVSYYENEDRLRLPPEAEQEPAELDQLGDNSAVLLNEVLNYVRTRTGSDFTYYKRATIVRRISRRMLVTGVPELTAYLDHLRTHPGEAAALVNDMLISVTNFFRDRSAFEQLQEHIPHLFRGKAPGDAVRVWCAACATGEEAYSLAMLLLEHAREMTAPPMLQVFGCDLGEEAIQVARAGLYPDTIAADVSEERLRRFFIKEPNGWRVRRELREMVLFTTHDLLRDAPFSRMDLVSCRNLMIYLNRDAQARALDLFHFALKPGALLFLGTSESVEERNTLFVPVHKKYRLYQHRPARRVSMTLPSGAGEAALHRVIEQHERLKLAVMTPPDRPVIPHALAPSLPWSGFDQRDMPVNELHFKLLGRYGPASIIVNAEYDILHLSENANRYLKMPEGEPSRNLLRLVQPRLRVELRSVLLRAVESQQTVEMPRRRVELPNGERIVNIQASPAGDLAQGALLVIFTESDSELPGDELISHGDPMDSAAVLHLERELNRTNAALRATVEQYEASTEELKAGNEELQAMNEELRSAAEELETSREELQSVNEELTTVNSELKTRVEELARANSDLHNLMSATQIATIFLDRELQVKRYTPPAAPLFNLIPSDIGRPIAHLHRQLDYPELGADAEQVLSSLMPVERELHENGRWFLSRVLPYRTVDDHIAGVVLTFIDISERRKAEIALRANQAWLQGQNEALQAALRDVPLSSALAPLVHIAAASQQSDIQSAFYLVDAAGTGLTHVAGMSAAYAECVDGFPVGEDSLACGLAVTSKRPVITADVLQEPRWAPWRWLAEKHGYRACWSFPIETEHKVIGTFAMYFDAPREASPKDLEFAMSIARVAAIIVSRYQEVEERTRAETALRRADARFRLAVEASDFATWEWLVDADEFVLNERYFTILGLAPQQEPLSLQAFFENIYPDDREHVQSELQRALRSGDVFQLEFRLRSSDGSVCWMRGYGRVVEADSDGKPVKMSGVLADVNDAKQSEEALRQSRESLQLIVANAREYAIIAMDKDRRITNWNAGAENILGYKAEQILGHCADLIFTAEDRAAGAPENEAMQALAHGQATDERWHIRQDGSIFWGSGMMHAMRDASGSVIGLLKIFRDQTAVLHAKNALEQSRQELKQALAETEQARDEAEVAGKAKDHFLAALSHELRTPLTPLMLSIYQLQRDPSLTPAARHSVDVIHRNGRLEAQLIDDLLDVTRIATGKLVAEQAPVSVRAVVASAVDISKPDLDAKQQQLELRMADGEDGMRGDAKLLQQVFWNLLKNASKFTPVGGTIGVAVEFSDHRAVITLRDNGVGFEPGVEQRLFEPFEQGSSSVTRKFGGLGLGLSIVKANIAAHGGTVQAASDGPGKGAVFTVMLPLH